MALLDFRCEACGEKFYELVKTSDKTVVKCPKCDSNAVKQIFEGKAAFGTTGKSSSGHIHRGG